MIRNYLSIPYFLLNLSTRPPVSTSFCLPVKNGWHLEQISTRISPFVERVSITSPHAQMILLGVYSGCIPSFIKVTSFILCVILHANYQHKSLYHTFIQIASFFLQNFSIFQEKRRDRRASRLRKVPPYRGRLLRKAWGQSEF